jgi:hypothetical protein
LLLRGGVLRRICLLPHWEDFTCSTVPSVFCSSATPSQISVKLWAAHNPCFFSRSPIRPCAVGSRPLGAAARGPSEVGSRDPASAGRYGGCGGRLEGGHDDHTFGRRCGGCGGLYRAVQTKFLFIINGRVPGTRVRSGGKCFVYETTRVEILEWAQGVRQPSESLGVLSP